MHGELRRHERTRGFRRRRLREIGGGSAVELLAANTRDILYLFARDGQCRRVSIHEIPPHGVNRHLAELTEFSRRDEITAALAFRVSRRLTAQGYLFLVTEQGMVKRMTLEDFLSAAASDPVVMNVDDKDRLRWVLAHAGRAGGDAGLGVGPVDPISRRRKCAAWGWQAGGVGGMRLKKGDKLVSAHVVAPEGELVTMTELGYAKRTELSQYSGQGRNGGGIVTHKTNSRTGPICAAYMLDGGDVETLIMVHQKGGVKLIEVEDDTTGRAQRAGKKCGEGGGEQSGGGDEGGRRPVDGGRSCLRYGGGSGGTAGYGCRAERRRLEWRCAQAARQVDGQAHQEPNGESRHGRCGDHQGGDLCQAEHVSYFHGQIRHGQIRHGQIRHGQIRHGQIRHGQIRHGQIRHGQVRHGQVRRGQVRREKTGAADAGVTRTSTVRTPAKGNSGGKTSSVGTPAAKTASTETTRASTTKSATSKANAPKTTPSKAATKGKASAPTQSTAKSAARKPASSTSSETGTTKAASTTGATRKSPAAKSPASKEAAKAPAKPEGAARAGTTDGAAQISMGLDVEVVEKAKKPQPRPAARKSRKLNTVTSVKKPKK